MLQFDIVWQLVIHDYHTLFEFQDAKNLALVCREFFSLVKPIVEKLYLLQESAKSPYKVVVVGDYSVGKSNILSQFKYETYQDEINFALKEDFIKKFVFVENKPILLQVWDTPRPSPYRYNTSLKYSNTCGAIIVFDVTNQLSFDNVLTWFLEIQMSCMELVHIALVGNKADLSGKRVVAESTIKGIAERMSIPYYETSAKTGEGIENLFQKFAEDMVKGWAKVNSNEQEPGKGNKAATPKKEKCVLL
eukprot:Phypoly_transcript_13731.p1 GENE.Phypoly_transcript_13731~~Phypoly_transcript_13731.p1  ORF type:complete len:248 (-),score=38.40 Phypoly_transcript_13731:233-976(-)